MKKLLIVTLTLSILFSLVACNLNVPNDGINDSDNTTSETDQGNNNGENQNPNNTNQGLNKNPICGELQEHVYYYKITKKTHQKVCVCGQIIEEDSVLHDFQQEDNRCNICSYYYNQFNDGLAFGVPYTIAYTDKGYPVSLTFYSNQKCIANFVEEKNQEYTWDYFIDGDYVYLNIDLCDDYNVFKITECGLILDNEKTPDPYWFWYESRGTPAVYLKSEDSLYDVLSAVVMANNNLDSLPKIPQIYGQYEVTSSYGQVQTATVFAAYTQTTKGSWVDKVVGTECTFTYPDGREILVYFNGRIYTLDRAYDKGYVSLDIIEKLNEEFSNCLLSHNYNDGVINSENKIEYTCKTCKDKQYVELPGSFSFTLTFGFDGYYNSETGRLSNGHNYTLDQDCETTLLFDQNELMEIYKIFYNGNYQNMEGDIRVSDSWWEPSYDIRISYTIDGVKNDVKILNASYITYSEWEIYPEFGYAYYKIVNDFIKASDEFKSLPPNENLYD